MLFFLIHTKSKYYKQRQKVQTKKYTKEEIKNNARGIAKYKVYSIQYTVSDVNKRRTEFPSSNWVEYFSLENAFGFSSFGF